MPAGHCHLSLLPREAPTVAVGISLSHDAVGRLSQSVLGRGGSPVAQIERHRRSPSSIEGTARRSPGP